MVTGLIVSNRAKNLFRLLRLVIGHAVFCLITHIAMKLDRKLTWNPDKELFVNDNEANAMLSRSQRAPYGTDYIQM